jgi:hypothetical protein
MQITTFLTVILTMSMPLASLRAAPMHRPDSRGVQRVPVGPIIHVLLQKDVPSALVEAKGSYRVIRKDNGVSLSHGSSGKRFVMYALQQGLRWGEEYPDVYQISVIPTSPQTTISVDGIQYKGGISVYHMRGNHIALINDVPIEEFLKSTLSVKYDDSQLSDEALAALAIIDRTEAYSRVLGHVNNTRPWDVVANEVNYFGAGVPQSKQVFHSIESTRYMVLESLKENTPLANPHLSPSKADELAQTGMDAQKILRSAFPTAKIGATISADEVAVR